MTKPYTIPTQGKENEMEKLVEEIAIRLHQFWVDTLRNKTPAGLRHLEDQYAEVFITRILKAVVDGELDEALGVVGRGEMNVADLAIHIGSCKSLEVEGDVVNIIALSPFPRDPLGTGAGKEEEEE